jgi:hypothetical protein
VAEISAMLTVKCKLFVNFTPTPFIADSETANYELFNQLFITRLDLQKIKPLKSNRQLPGHSMYTGFYSLEPNNIAQFSWIDWMFNSVWLTENNGYLHIMSLQQEDKKLENMASNLFRMEGRQLPSHVFMKGEKWQFSTGLDTYEKNSPLLFLLNWLSMIVGFSGFLFLLIKGTSTLVSRTQKVSTVQLLPYFNMIAFVIPVYLFFQQSFLEFGEKTTASIFLAVLSGSLPIVLVIGLIKQFSVSKSVSFDLLGIIAALQLCLLLVYWRVVPLVFWQ